MDLKTIRTRLRSRRDDGSTKDSRYDGWINEALQTIYSHSDWSWLREDTTHDLRPAYTQSWDAMTGAFIPLQALFKQNSSAVILGGDIQSPVYGHTLLANGRSFRIINVIDPTHVQIDPPWFDADGTYDASILNNEMGLPRGVKSILGVERGSGNTPVSMISVTSREARAWDLSASGAPTQYSTVRRDPLPAPIKAPTPANGAGIGPTGTYTYWQTYYDPATGAESKLSPASTPFVAIGVPVIVTPTQRGDFWWRVYRSTNGGTTPYFLSEIPSTTNTYSDTWGDELLGARATGEAGTQYVYFWPPPSSTEQILLTVSLVGAALSADSDEPSLPEEDISVLLDGAEFRALNSTEEQSRATGAYKVFQRGLARMVIRDKPDRSSLIYIGGSDRLLRNRGRRFWVNG